MANVCPCKDCAVHGKCGEYHDRCSDYLSWKRERSEIQAKIRAQKDTFTNHDEQPFWKKHHKDNKRGQM